MDLVDENRVIDAAMAADDVGRLGDQGTRGAKRELPLASKVAAA